MRQRTLLDVPALARMEQDDGFGVKPVMNEPLLTSTSRRALTIAVAIAAAVVVVLIAVVVVLWRTVATSEISGAGWVAMALGVLLTIALGVGLMSLVFISNRRGYDDDAGDTSGDPRG
jgi:hypothetical protein